MTKDEAINAMQQGDKVTHRLFAGYEYIFMKDGVIFDDDNNAMPNFWVYRWSPYWEKDWSILKK